jgi:phenylalanyl-tRNA synthetase beta chain
MNFSLNWIRDYININLSPEEIADRLSKAGLLVESITLRGGDFLLDIEIHANRPDWMSVLGICRELAAATAAKLQQPPLDYNEISDKTSDFITVEILDPELCPRYCAKLIRDVKVGPSPEWLAEKLSIIGLHPINNIVDVTNFVLWEIGHPLHAFDYKNIDEGTIIVRRGKRGEKLTTIDEVQRDLDEDVLVIADAHKPIAIGGVMGGINSHITNQTKDVLLEAAYFSPISIRRTAKKYNLDTDASHRFERGCDPEAPHRAIDRTCHLLEKIAQGRVCQEVVDVYPLKVPNKKIHLRITRAEKLLGIALDDEKVEKTFKKLELSLGKNNNRTYEVSIPSFRVDIIEEIDLIEEIARFYGYHNIPSTLPPLKEIDIKDTDRIKIRAFIRSLLCNSGYTEAINYSFVDEHKNLLFDEREKRDLIHLKNPIADNMKVMRTNLLPGLMENIVINQNYGTTDIRLFEIGKCFFPTSAESLPIEKEALGIVTSGYRGNKLWKDDYRQTDFFDLKGIIEFLFKRLKCEGIKFENKVIKYLHPGQSASIIFNEKEIGSLGMLHPKLAQYFSIKDTVYIAHIFVDILLDRKLEKAEYQERPKYPGIRRDISFIIEESLQFSDIKNLIDTLSEEIIFDVKIIDRYKGAQLPEGKKSLSISIYYQSSDRTLKAEEVSQVHEKIINLLKSNLKAELR